jgi:type II secretory pathway component PulM
MGNDDPLSVSVAEQRVHIHYLGRGQQTIEQRISSIEAELGRHRSMLSTVSSVGDRLRRMEASAATLKIAGGVLMLVLARSGLVTGEGAKVVEKVGSGLLGGF